MYTITQEQRDRYNANRRAKKANETPEEREARLARRRESDHKRVYEGGEELRKRTREQALAYVNRKRAEDPDFDSKRYKQSKVRKERRASELAASLRPGEYLCPRCLRIIAEEDLPMTRTGERATLCAKCFKLMTGAYDIDCHSFWVSKAKALYHRTLHRKSYAVAPDGVNGKNKVTADCLRAIYDKQEHKCAYCSIPLTALITAVDHKVPLSRGGVHEPDNVQLLCHNCNISKFTMTDEEYRKYVL